MSNAFDHSATFAIYFIFVSSNNQQPKRYFCPNEYISNIFFYFFFILYIQVKESWIFTVI